MTNTRLRQRCSGLGAVHHQTVGKIGESGGPPNALRFCCGGLRRPPPPRLTYPAAGPRAQAPASSKRVLGRLLRALPLGASGHLLVSPVEEKTLEDVDPKGRVDRVMRTVF